MQELLESSEPAFVIVWSGRVVCVCAHRLICGGNFGNQTVTKLIPWVEALLAQGDRQGKNTSFPRVVENQFSAFARQGSYSAHAGNTWVGETIHSFFLFVLQLTRVITTCVSKRPILHPLPHGRGSD